MVGVVVKALNPPSSTPLVVSLGAVLYPLDWLELELVTPPSPPQ